MITEILTGFCLIFVTLENFNALLRWFKKKYKLRKQKKAYQNSSDSGSS